MPSQWLQLGLHTIPRLVRSWAGTAAGVGSVGPAERFQALPLTAMSLAQVSSSAVQALSPAPVLRGQLHDGRAPPAAAAAAITARLPAPLPLPSRERPARDGGHYAARAAARDRGSQED